MVLLVRGGKNAPPEAGVDNSPVPHSFPSYDERPKSLSCRNQNNREWSRSSRFSASIGGMPVCERHY